MITGTAPCSRPGLASHVSTLATGDVRRDGCRHAGGHPSAVSAPRGELRLEVARGLLEVIAAMPPSRVAEWRALAEAAPHVAVYQGPAFVLTWYEVYEPDYEPLLLLGLSAAGALVGVLPLALRRGGAGGMVFAGAEHCEYAGWLSIPGLRAEFPARCVAHLHAHGWFATPWDWKWLAPGAVLDWLDHPVLRERGIVGRVREATTPVLRLQDPDRPRFFSPRKKNFKRKMNLLRARGEVQLTRLDAVDIEGALFDRFTTFYDVRQLSRYGAAPFADDPLKAVFHRRLLQGAPEVARCFALMAGEDPVAFSFDIVDRRRAVYCMAPFDLARLGASPGKLIMDLVADVFTGQGFECFDYSPGGDEYKDEAASAHEPVQRLELFPSPARARFRDASAAARDLVKRVAVRAGVSRERMQRAREMAARVVAEPAPAVLWRAGRSLKERVWSSKAVVIYRFERRAWSERYPDAHPDPLFRRDALEDFLAYRGSMRWLSRHGLLELAIRRLRDGEQCYTAVENGALVHFAWLQPDPRTVQLSEVGRALVVPTGTAVTHEVFTEPRAGDRGLHRRSLQHRLHEAFAHGAEAVVTAIEETDAVSMHNAEMVGFRRVARVSRIRRFGRARWVEEGRLRSEEGATG